jgi:uncharacterized BrkB/YihY/UPF0761 family membrane protein
MKSQSLVIKLLLSSAIFFIGFTLLMLLFKNFKILDIDKSSTSDVIAGAAITTALYFLFMFFWIKKRIKRQK